MSTPVQRRSLVSDVLKETNHMALATTKVVSKMNKLEVKLDQQVAVLQGQSESFKMHYLEGQRAAAQQASAPPSAAWVPPGTGGGADGILRRNGDGGSRGDWPGPLNSHSLSRSLSSAPPAEDLLRRWRARSGRGCGIRRRRRRRRRIGSHNLSHRPPLSRSRVPTLPVRSWPRFFVAVPIL